MSDKFNIKLNIVGKTYPMTIQRSDEEKYRRAERDINELVNKFKTRFRAENDDYLAMAALQISLANVEKEMGRNMDDHKEELGDIERMLDDYISKTL